MALGDSYATLAELRSRLGVTDTMDDGRMTYALLAASQGIEQTTNRQFNDAGVTSARVYHTSNWYCANVDDFHTLDGLIIEVDNGDDGLFDTTWQAGDYEVRPLNGIVDSVPGWPYNEIVSVENRYFNAVSRRANLRVTARWGWAQVPGSIKEAALIVAAEIFKLKDAPFGVAGFGEYGAVRVRQNPMARAMIAPYIRDPILVG